MSLFPRKHLAFGIYCAAHFTGTFLEGGLWVQWSGWGLSLCVYSKLSGLAWPLLAKDTLGMGVQEDRRILPEIKRLDSSVTFPIQMS